MKPLSLHLAVVIAFGLIHSNLLGQSNSDAQTEIAKLQEIANRFCESYNSGSLRNLLPLLTPKTKATLMMAHAVSNGTAPKSQQGKYEEFGKKWQPRIQAFIESESIDMASGSQWHAINELSRWPLLDAYLSELDQVNVRPRSRPSYVNSNDIIVNGDRAQGSIALRTNGGVLAGLNGNSIKSIDAGSVRIFLIKVAGKWLVCHENEYNGELDPADLKDAN